MVEDAPLGVEAGRAAGMTVLMVPHPKMDRKESREANMVVGDLTMFSPGLVGLPDYGYQPASHLIFDMDGLLLNTQQIYSRVGGELLAKHGKTSDQSLRMKVIGRRMEEAAVLIVEHYGLPYTPQQYISIFETKANEVGQTSVVLSLPLSFTPVISVISCLRPPARCREADQTSPPSQGSYRGRHQQLSVNWESEENQQAGK